jgi:transposase
MLEHTIKQKQIERDGIARQTQEYLKSGGEIKTSKILIREACSKLRPCEATSAERGTNAANVKRKQTCLERKKEAKELYKSGSTHEELAKMYGVKLQTIDTYLRGMDNKSYAAKTAEARERLNSAINMYQAGVEVAHIAEKLGITRNTVNKYIRAARQARKAARINVCK